MSRYYKLLNNSEEDREEAENWIGRMVFSGNINHSGEKHIRLMELLSIRNAEIKIVYRLSDIGNLEDIYLYDEILVPIDSIPEQKELDHFDCFSKKQAVKYIGKEVEFSYGGTWLRGVLKGVSGYKSPFEGEKVKGVFPYDEKYETNGYFTFCRPIKIETRKLTAEELKLYYEEKESVDVDIILKCF